MTNEIAVFGGGCFWCTEAIFNMIKGVNLVKPGYAEGAEVVYIEYDPGQVGYKNLLTVFFASHDPTSLNRQGADVGSQYRSVIFYTSDNQKEEAFDFIKDLNDSNSEGGPIVTEVSPLEKFYDAESYHKDYFENHKENPYCQIVINPKLEKVQKEFANLLKTLK